MEKTELRIGNLVEYPAWNNDVSKAYFSIRDIHFDEGKIGLTNGIIKLPSSHLDFIKPIQLTEEWLLKFGFEKADEIYFIEFDVYSMTIKEYEKGNYILNPETHFNYVDIKYVHQLQNLYFALTNEELTLNHEK